MADLDRRSVRPETKHGALAAFLCLLAATPGFTTSVPGVVGNCHALGRPELRQADTFDALSDNVWYLPTSDKAAHLYVTSIGQGPDVVVLHGGAGGDFNYLVDAIRPASDAFHFILFDQRGSALSPVPDDAIHSITLDTLADDLETLRIALKQPRLRLVAHSAGTLLAMHYFERHPDHVAAMVLTGSFPPRTPEGGMSAQINAMRARTKLMMARPAVAAVLAKEGLAGKSGELSPKDASARNRIVGFADFDLVHVERWRTLQGGGVFYNGRVDDAVSASLASVYDITPTWLRHPIPITIVQGDQDYTDPGAGQWAQTNARIHVIPDASHVAWIDNPKAFATALRDGLCR